MNQPDIVYIKDLQVSAIIGIFDWERQIKQTVSIDLEMATDIRKAALSDKIDDALNYKSIGKRISSYIEQSDFQLVVT